MSLSCILRGGISALRVRQSLGLIAKYSTLSSPVAYQKFLSNIYDDKSLLLKDQNNTKNKLTEVVKHFSTTPSRLSGHGNHSRTWTLERCISAGLLVMAPLAIKFPNILFDVILAVGAVMHMHWGLEAIIIDYIRPIIVGNILAKLAPYTVYILSVFTLVGLFNLIFTNCGLGNSIRLIWKL